MSQNSSAALFYLSALTNLKMKLKALGVPLVGLKTSQSHHPNELAAAAVVSMWAKTCRAHIVITDETYDPVSLLQRTYMAKHAGRSAIQCPMYAVDSNFVVPVRNAANFLSDQQRIIMAASNRNNVLTAETYKDILNRAIRNIFQSDKWRSPALKPLSKAIQASTHIANMQKWRSI